MSVILTPSVCLLSWVMAWRKSLSICMLPWVTARLCARDGVLVRSSLLGHGLDGFSPLRHRLVRVSLLGHGLVRVSLSGGGLGQDHSSLGLRFEV